MKQRIPLLLLLLFLFISLPLYQNIQRTVTIASKTLDLQALSVAQLERILITRGVSYDVSEKRAMIEQVQMTGMVVQEDLDEDSVTPEPKYFRCESEFEDQLKTDSRQESSWLIRIMHPTHRNVSKDDIWRSVEPKLALLGLRVGILECCRSNNRLCSRWHKDGTGLALISPSAHGKLSVYHSPLPGSEAALYQWMSDQLGSSPAVIDEEMLADSWLPNTACQVLFVSDSSAKPPLFFSLLSSRFAGQIPFGNLQNFTGKSLGGLQIADFPAYIVLTSGHQFSFGERLSFRSMEAFLLGLRPDFYGALWSCCSALILLASLDLFFISGQGLIRCLAGLVLVTGFGLGLRDLYLMALRKHWSQWEALPYVSTAVFFTVSLLHLAVYMYILEREAPGMDRQSGRRLQPDPRQFDYIQDLKVWTWYGDVGDAKGGSCIFCQFDFSHMDTLCTLPCHHTFHREEIQTWLLNPNNQHRCPTCRQPCRG